MNNQVPKKLVIICTPEVTGKCSVDNLRVIASSCAFKQFNHYKSELLCPTSEEVPDNFVEEAINVFGKESIFIMHVNGEGKHWANKIDKSNIISLSDASEIHEAERKSRYSENIVVFSM